MRRNDISPELGAAVFDAAPDSIIVASMDGLIRFVNRRTLDLFGYSAEELIGIEVEILVPLAYRGMHRMRRRDYAGAPRARPMGTGLDLVARRKNGSELPVEISLSPVELGNEGLVVAILRDVTEQRRAAQEFRYIGTHDALTGLFNRGFLEAELERMERSRRFPIGVIIADLDDLKQTNDSRGHEEGDRYLQRVAHLLTTTFRPEDIVARIGGDEFAVLLPEVNDDQVRERIALLRGRFDEYNREQEGCPIAVSFGGAAAENGALLRQAFKLADERMYREKAQRKGRCP